jgi:hypothetical protein
MHVLCNLNTLTAKGGTVDRTLFKLKLGCDDAQEEDGKGECLSEMHDVSRWGCREEKKRRQVKKHLSLSENDGLNAAESPVLPFGVESTPLMRRAAPVILLYGHDIGLRNWVRTLSV